MYKNISSDQSIIEESFAYANKCWSSHLINPKYVEHTPNELIVRLLARFFNRGLKLIDIGSGYGKNSLTLAQHFYQVDLVDASLSSSSCYASLAQDCDNINIYKKYVYSAADMSTQIDDKSVILTTYLFDHMPEGVALDLFSSLLDQISLCTGYVGSFFLNTSFDPHEYPINESDIHKVRPFYSKDVEALKSTLENGPKSPYFSNRSLLKANNSSIPFELHTYFSKSAICNMLASCAAKHDKKLSLITTSESWHDSEHVDSDSAMKSLDILYFVLY